MRLGHSALIRAVLVLAGPLVAACGGAASGITGITVPESVAYSKASCARARDRAALALASAQSLDGEARRDAYRRAGEAYRALWQRFADRTGATDEGRRCTSGGTLRILAARAHARAGDTVLALDMLTELAGEGIASEQREAHGEPRDEEDDGRRDEQLRLAYYEMGEAYSRLGFFRGAAFAYAEFARRSGADGERARDAIARSLTYYAATDGRRGVDAIAELVIASARRSARGSLPLLIQLADYYADEGEWDRVAALLAPQVMRAIDAGAPPLLSVTAHAIVARAAQASATTSAERATAEFRAVLDLWAEAVKRGATGGDRAARETFAPSGRARDAAATAALYLERAEAGESPARPAPGVKNRARALDAWVQAVRERAERATSPHARVVALGDALPLDVRLAERARVGELWDEAADEVDPRQAPERARAGHRQPDRAPAEERTVKAAAAAFRERARTELSACVEEATRGSVDEASRVACDVALARHEKPSARAVEEILPVAHWGRGAREETPAGSPAGLERESSDAP